MIMMISYSHFQLNIFKILLYLKSLLEINGTFINKYISIKSTKVKTNENIIRKAQINHF